MADIELVIKMPEEEYKIIKNRTGPMVWIEHLIKNGIPLPKGHGRLIDADALEYEIASIEGYSEYDYECVAREDIDQAPTIIEADEEVEEE